VLASPRDRGLLMMGFAKSSTHPTGSPRHCKPPGRANARPGVRSNPATRACRLDCFVARAPRNDGGKVLPKRERHSLLPTCRTSTFAFHGNGKSRNKAGVAAFDPSLETMSNAKLLMQARDQRFFVLSLLSVSSHPL
jgi:hypothetical protein